MNNITTYQPRAVATAEVDPEAMFRMAKAIAASKLFGSEDPNAVFTLMLLAQAEGKHPGLVMRDYHVIKGKPAKKADAMLVDFLASGGTVEWHRLDDEEADATFSHPAGGSVRIAWDSARVKQADIGGNPMHKKYPRQMKRARVISEGVRTVFPGATGGLYVPEEVADFDEARPTSDPASRAPAPRMPAPKRPQLSAPAPQAEHEPQQDNGADYCAETHQPDEPEPQNDALDFDHEAAAAMLEAEYAATRTFLGLRDIWEETKADRQAIMARDPEYKAKFAAMLDREKARLAG